MKKLLLALTLVSTGVSADPITFVALQATIPPIIYQAYRDDKTPEQKDPVTVVATGVGNTCEKALENAKVVAVDKVAGLWMSTERNTNGDNYNESITDYSGGIIKSYTIIDNQCNNVTIEAQVVPRSNKISSNSANVNNVREHLKSKIDNEHKRQLAIKEVNNRSKAIGFEIKDIQFEMNKLIVSGKMFFNDKWKHDYHDLKSHAGSFNLDSFHKPVYVNLKGYNNGNVILDEKYQLDYNRMQLYSIDREGKVTIYTNRSDELRLTFLVNSGKIVDVDKLVVNFM